MELMSVVAKLNDIMLSADGSDIDPQQTKAVDQLESQLSSLRQFLVLRGSLDGMLDENTILRIADLYRLAALIYSERACRRKIRSSIEVTRLVQNAFKILGELQVCTAPWPLFIVGCEAETDSQRSLTLQLLERSANYRKSDNILWIKKLIKGIWKQDDLSTYSHLTKAIQPLLRYRSVLSASSQLPNFW